jgi:uncharacterized protein (DUF1919 family)
MASKPLEIGQNEVDGKGVRGENAPLPAVSSDSNGAKDNDPIEGQLLASISNEAPNQVSRNRPLNAFIKTLRSRVGSAVNLAGLEEHEFTVISNDCWGQALYEEYGLPIQTPLIGSGMYADCFIRFLGDIEGYLSSPLQFVGNSRHLALGRVRNQRWPWPIAVLRGDVEVHFLHLRTEDACRRAWEAGCEKLNLKRIAVKFSADKDGATEEHIKQFVAMPFERKLLISRYGRPNISCAVQTPNYVINGAVMFRRSIKHFDCTHWLNTGEVLRSSPRVWINKVLYARGV